MSTAETILYNAMRMVAAMTVGPLDQFEAQAVRSVALEALYSHDQASREQEPVAAANESTSA